MPQLKVPQEPVCLRVMMTPRKGVKSTKFSVNLVNVLRRYKNIRATLAKVPYCSCFSTMTYLF